jgi:tetratricopeptide (TPR) repeat protein
MGLISKPSLMIAERILLAAAILAVILPGSRGLLCQQTADSALDDGMRALKSGDFAAAERIFADLHSHAATAENANDLAMAEAGEHKFDQAISHFGEAIRLGNDTAPVRYNLGVVYLNSGREDEGIGELRLAAAKDPKFQPALRTLGIALLKSNQARVALPYLEQARNLAPQDGEVWIDNVEAEFQTQNTNGATQVADRAIKALPANAPLDEALADLCVKYGQLQKARDILEAAVEEMPGNPDIELALARVSLQAGEAMEALAALKDVPAAAGLPGEPDYLRGEARMLTKDYVIAKVDLSAAIQADPNNPRYLVAYARLQQVEGDYDKALVTLTKAGELKNQSAEIPFRMAVSYYYQGLWEQTERSCEKALELQPHFVLADLLIGAAKFRANDIEGSQEALQRVVVERPNTPFFHVALAVVLYRTECLEASLKELDRALSLDPQMAVAHYYKARVYTREKQPRKAIAELETAVALQPHYREAYAQLARLYTEVGQPEKAKAALANHAAELQTEEVENQRMVEQIHDSMDDIDSILKLSEILKSR